MPPIIINRIRKSAQYSISLVLVILVSSVCYALSAYLGYRVVALILLLTVSIIAISFDILPVLITATLTAVIWDFFFIPPRFNFHVDTTEDSILLVMYFVIALINAVLTYKIRQAEKASRLKEEKANAIKLYDTLLNSLSHELRTPIATILGASDNLLARDVNLSEESKEQLVMEISKASLRLNLQVENLLNMSRLESGFIKPRRDWCDISEMIYGLVRKIEDEKITQVISIRIEPGMPLFRLDKGMLEQVIYNLLINACNHTPAGSRIYVSARHQGNLLEIIVEDNGMGFPKEELEQVFNKFYRLKNTRAKGTGLGLSIVKGFTEAMGGQVQLENISTGGARFTIGLESETLPIITGT